MSDETKPTEGMETESGEVNSAGVDITPGKDGGLLKTVTTEGSGDDRPPGQGETVFVHYVGTLLDGSKFDSSRDRGEKFEFKLGTGAVIKAWDLGVTTMRRGEVAVFTCRADYAYGESGSPPKIPPNATLVFEVELFDWKGEDLSPEKDGGIERNVLKKGDGYITPNDGASCTAHIIGRYEGVVFEDRSVDFVIGEGSEHGVVEGVEIALQKFKKGEKSLLKMSSKYAYGQAGCAEHNIPAGATLHYEVQLEKFEKTKESWEMEPQEKIEQSEIVKTKGGNHFKAGKYKMACKYYKKIKDYLEHETDLKDEEAKKKDALLLVSHLNLAMCYLKLEDPVLAITECDLALETDADNVKGLFRRGQAYAMRSDYELAKNDFAKVVELDPTNKAAKNQLSVVAHKIKQDREKEKKIYSGMFSKFAAADNKKKSVVTEKEKEETSESVSKEQKATSLESESS